MQVDQVFSNRKHLTSTVTMHTNVSQRWSICDLTAAFISIDQISVYSVYRLGLYLSLEPPVTLPL